MVINFENRLGSEEVAAPTRLSIEAFNSKDGILNYPTITAIADANPGLVGIATPYIIPDLETAIDTNATFLGNKRVHPKFLVGLLSCDPLNDITANLDNLTTTQLEEAAKNQRNRRNVMQLILAATAFTTNTALVTNDLDLYFTQDPITKAKLLSRRRFLTKVGTLAGGALLVSSFSLLRDQFAIASAQASEPAARNNLRLASQISSYTNHIDWTNNGRLAIAIQQMENYGMSEGKVLATHYSLSPSGSVLVQNRQVRDSTISEFFSKTAMSLGIYLNRKNMYLGMDDFRDKMLEYIRYASTFRTYGVNPADATIYLESEEVNQMVEVIGNETLYKFISNN